MTKSHDEFTSGNYVKFEFSSLAVEPLVNASGSCELDGCLNHR